MNDPMSESKPSRSCLAVFLVLAGSLLLFAMGRYTVALAAWLAPVFLLRYTRTAPSKWALVPAWIIMFLAFLFQMRGMVPLPPAGFVGIGLAAALWGGLPYVIDRFARRTNSGFSSTLIFPCAVTAMDFSTTLSPYGSWGVLGYSQHGNLPIMQLAAVTGVYGISFLVAWLAPVANWAWERGFAWHRIRQGIMIFVGVLGSIYALGSARLLLSSPEATQRIAGIAAESHWTFLNQSVQNCFWEGKPVSDAELAPTKADLIEQQDQLLLRSEREAKAGAKLVFWSEIATWTLTPDEPALIAKGADFARRNHVYLGMALGSIDLTQSKLHQNIIVLLGPDGNVLLEYWKSRPVPGWEKATTAVNGNPMRFVDTPLGRVGAFICFDLTFPSLARQAGRAHTDLMISPASDWAAIDPWNSYMLAFRAVENGFNLVRNVANGRSLAVDYLGRTIAETDYFTNAGHVIVADMPIHGVKTIYATLGDLFSWLCIGALFVLIPMSLRAKAAKERSP